MSKILLFINDKGLYSGCTVSRPRLNANAEYHTVSRAALKMVRRVCVNIQPPVE